MSKREIAKRIWLSGTWPDGCYTVHHDLDGTEGFILVVPQAEIGHAIVKALRELAARKKQKPHRGKSR
jgi:hypothetical protein